jgi:hypothetical protein
LNTFCTIITPSFVPFANTIYASLKQYHVHVHFNILLVTTNTAEIEQAKNALHKEISFFTPTTLCADGMGKKIFDKYFNAYIDRFRWSMKSVFISFLLEKKEYNKVIFFDPDIFVTNNCNFLFDELDRKDVILTPHWRPMRPFNQEVYGQQHINFEYLFTNGLYNAGFIGVQKKGIPLMNWWAEACYYRCEINPAKGFYDDQAYLNLFPLLSENVGIVYHRGCNVADWNISENKISLHGDEIIVNEKHPVIFVHFTQSLIKTIQQQNGNHLLQKLLNAYTTLFESVNSLPFPNRVITTKSKTHSSWFMKIKYYIRIRTRIKKFIKG